MEVKEFGGVKGKGEEGRRGGGGRTASRPISLLYDLTRGELGETHNH